jgi:hypothetical protein
MKRREFITLLGGATAWPVIARAQQPATGARRVGFLLGFAENDAQAQDRVAALRDGLRRSVGSRTATFKSSIVGRAIMPIL